MSKEYISKTEAAEYARRTRALKGGNSTLDIPMTREGMYFRGADNDEPAKCSYFGCGLTLTLQEQRFGNRCINHQKI